MRALSLSDRAIVGFLVGLVLGVGLSTAAALYITNSPVPFVNKVQRPTEKVNPGAGGQLPDPNRPLYSNHAAVPVAPADRPPEAAPAAAVGDKGAAKLAGAAPAPVPAPAS